MGSRPGTPPARIVPRHRRLRRGLLLDVDERDATVFRHGRVRRERKVSIFKWAIAGLFKLDRYRGLSQSV